MIKTAKKNGMNALAITDHGNMYGAIELYKEANKAGIKPIRWCSRRSLYQIFMLKYILRMDAICLTT